MKETRSLRERAKRELRVLKRWLEKKRAAVGFVRRKERACFAKGNKWSRGKGLENVPGILWHGERSYVMEVKTFLGEKEAIELS